MKNCVKCKIKDCMNCPNGKERYTYPKTSYKYDWVDIADTHTGEEPEAATHLDPEDEDKLRIAICNLFSLSQLELLMLQSIINGQSLEEFAKSMTDLINKQSGLMLKNADGKFTRFHAFQLRKAILKKLPTFKNALLTSGQRKELKN